MLIFSNISILNIATKVRHRKVSWKLPKSSICHIHLSFVTICFCMAQKSNRSEDGAWHALLFGFYAAGECSVVHQDQDILKGHLVIALCFCCSFWNRLKPYYFIPITNSLSHMLWTFLLNISKIAPMACCNK